MAENPSGTTEKREPLRSNDLLSGVHLSDGRLWGRAGGQLEYVGQRFEWRKNGDRVWPVIVLLFTDHDHWPGDDGELEPNVFYRAEFPISARTGAG